MFDHGGSRAVRKDGSLFPGEGRTSGQIRAYRGDIVGDSAYAQPGRRRLEEKAEENSKREAELESDAPNERSELGAEPESLRCASRSRGPCGASVSRFR